MGEAFFELIRGGKNSARRGAIRTFRGFVNTPAFMPVGSLGPVKTASPEEMANLGAEIILNNAYHLYLRPGVETIRKAGGLHKFTGWDRPILSDSGGFQFYSLEALKKIHNDGIEFQSHIDGSKHFFSPEKVVDIQNDFGSDIMMPLDICLPSPAKIDEARNAGELTIAWLRRSIDRLNSGADLGGRKIFGIVQGSTFANLRAELAQRVRDLDLSGYAIGGLAVGEEKERMWEIVRVVNDTLPVDRPRYLMGVGTPADVVRAVSQGIDMFDCVMPTRNARNGTVFTRHGRIVLKGANYSQDNAPIQDGCGCYACRVFSRAYIRHLINVNEILGLRLATIHNLHFYLKLMRDIREAISDGRFENFMAEFLRDFESGT